jgi:hypothetical protein
MQTQIEKDVSRELGTALRKMGESKAVTKFLNSYGNVRTKKAYCVHPHRLLPLAQGGEGRLSDSPSYFSGFASDSSFPNSRPSAVKSF